MNTSDNMEILFIVVMFVPPQLLSNSSDVRSILSLFPSALLISLRTSVIDKFYTPLGHPRTARTQRSSFFLRYVFVLSLLFILFLCSLVLLEYCRSEPVSLRFHFVIIANIYQTHQTQNRTDKIDIDVCLF